MRRLLEHGQDPLVTLADIANDPTTDLATRVQAAIGALPYLHPRLSAATVQTTTVSATIDSAALMDALNVRLDRLRAARGPVLDAVPESSGTIEAAPG